MPDSLIQSNSGSYTIVGAASRLAFVLAAAVGSYAVTGTTASTVHGYQVVNPPGVYTITGKSIQTRRIAAEPAGYQLQGQAVTLETGSPRLVVASGGYTVTGTAINFVRRIPGGVGSYVVAGTAATLTRSSTGNTLSAVKGTYSITGTPVSLESTVTILTGDYGVTGTAVTLRKGKGLFISSRSFNINGQAALLKHGIQVPVAQGTYVILAPTTQLVRSSQTAKSIVGNDGVFRVIGVAATLSPARKIAATPGSYTYTGFVTGSGIATESGTYGITGIPVSFIHIPISTVSSGVYSYTGQAALLRKVNLFNATSGLYTIFGVAQPLTLTIPLVAGQGLYDINGVSTFLRVTHIIVESGAYLLTGTIDVSRVPEVPTIPATEDTSAIPGTPEIPAIVGTHLVSTRPKRWRKQPARPAHAAQQTPVPTTWDEQPVSPGV